MCFQLFYHGEWTLIADVDNNLFLWPSAKKWHMVDELTGWLNGACNNL